MRDLQGLLKKIGKNVTAFVLMLGMLVSSTQCELMLSAEMLDPSQYYIKFIDKNYPTVQKGAMDMINVMGEMAEIVTKLKPDYTMDDTTPFRIFKKAAPGQTTGDEVTDANYFNAKGSQLLGNGKYSLEIMKADVPKTSYTLEAYYMTPDGGQGEGSASWHTKEWEEQGPNEGDPIIHPARTANADVVAKPTYDPPLLFDTTISFRVIQDPNSLGNFYLDSGAVATGYYGTLLGPKPSASSVSVIEKNGTIEIKVNFKGKQETDGEAAGSAVIITYVLTGINTTESPLKQMDFVTISTTWSRPRVNNLTLSLHEPNEAIELDASTLRSKPSVATAEDGKTYLTLDPGDTLNYVGGIFSNKITVRELVPRYNSELKVKWDFFPDNEKNKEAYPTGDYPSDTIKWKEGTGRIDIIEPPQDVYGSLVASFYYIRPGESKPRVEDQSWLNDDLIIQDPNNSGQLKVNPTWAKASATIPIKILGAGSPAKVSFTSKYGAKFSGNQVDQYKEEIPRDESPITFQMEVYGDQENGKVVPPEVYRPIEGDGSLPPYKIEGTIDYGSSKGAASKLVVKQEQIGGKGAVRLSTNDIVDYQWGSDILPPTPDTPSAPGKLTFSLQALEEGNVKLSFLFYNTRGEQLPDYKTISITITDNSPSPDSSLSELTMNAYVPSESELSAMTEEDKQSWKTFKEMYSADGLIEFGYDPEKTDYTEVISIPNIVDKIKLKPTYTVPKNTNKITVTLADSTFENFDTTIGESATKQILTPGKETDYFNLTEGLPVKIRVQCRAQNGFERTYTLTVMRAAKNTDATLQDIIVRPNDKSPEEDYFTLDPAFESGWTDYSVKVPYHYATVDVKAVATNPWASKIKFTQTPAPPQNLLSRLTGAFQRSEHEKIELQYSVDANGDVQNVTKVEIEVTAENNATQKYTVNITRDNPSNDASIQAPKASYWVANDHRTEIPLELDNGGFYPTEPEVFTKLVEYSTDRIRFVVTPNDYRAHSVTVSVDTGEADPPTDTKLCSAVGEEPQPLTFTFNNLKFPSDNVLKFKVEVLPESYEVNPPPKPSPFESYIIIVERKEPSRDLTADVTLTNMLTNAAIDFGYTNVIDSYPEKEVEYTPGDMKVLVQVKPKDAKTSVQVQGNSPRPDGTAVSLTTGSTTTVTIVLTAEDGSTRTITIPLKYKGPSNAAYLSNLTAGGLKFLPDPTPFDKKKTSYKIEIPKGTTTLPVTATLLKDGSKDDSSNATITIEGVTVKDGEAFNYQPTDKTGKITIVVTAQDGKTKRTYTITFKNWNLLIPNDEDTLKDLWVDYGDMQPEFSPAVTEYDVYVKPDAMDLKIYPKLKDKDGDIEVTAESKVLTQFEDYYSTSLMDDEMDIHIYVWSEKAVVESASSNTNTDAANTKPARSAAREYILHVYRNDEEKIGNLKPVTADMVDFTSADPIVIDITKYTVISAEVFNTLKTDYADKSIIFKGNDYTLQVFGADIDGLVPNAESFDLKFSFRTPDEDKILDIIDDSGRNGDIEPVYYYFNQHGALPGEMLLTVDLGRHYRNTELYWNYYNKERERIDYYGYVHTNAKGTFSVPISHFSTYLSTEDKIRGAENKSDEYGNPLLTPETENLNAPRSADKAIPNTGAGVTG